MWLTVYYYWTMQVQSLALMGKPYSYVLKRKEVTNKTGTKSFNHCCTFGKQKAVRHYPCSQRIQSKRRDEKVLLSLIPEISLPGTKWYIQGPCQQHSRRPQVSIQCCAPTCFHFLSFRLPSGKQRKYVSLLDTNKKRW